MIGVSEGLLAIEAVREFPFLAGLERQIGIAVGDAIGGIPAGASERREGVIGERRVTILSGHVSLHADGVGLSLQQAADSDVVVVRDAGRSPLGRVCVSLEHDRSVGATVDIPAIGQRFLLFEQPFEWDASALFHEPGVGPAQKGHRPEDRRQEEVDSGDGLAPVRGFGVGRV